MSGFAEYVDVSTSDPLRQGDVLEATGLDASIWARHLVVITADCDFAHGKHQGRVTCVPLLTFDEYLLELQIPKLREQLVKPHLERFRAIAAAAGRAGVSHGRLRAWVHEEEPDVIVASLELVGPTAEAGRAAIEALVTIDAPSKTLKEAVTALVEAQMRGSNSPTREKATQQILSRLRQPYGSPPGDALFLASIAPECEVGYFAYLRHLEQIWEPEITLGPSRRETRYRRISRLQDRFAHALVLKFATVFMAIGLPDEYEEMRDLYSDTLGDVLQ